MALSQQQIFNLKVQAAQYPKYKTFFDSTGYERAYDEWRYSDDDWDYAPTKDEYTSVDYGYYNSKNWQRVAKEIGIKNINSENDLREMYKHVDRLSATPAPKAAPAKPPTPKVDKVEQTYMKQIKTLEDQIKQIQKAPPKPTLPPPKPPTTPYSVGTTPISLSNPYKSKTLGGIGQFKSRANQGMATIKSGLVNI